MLYRAADMRSRLMTPAAELEAATARHILATRSAQRIKRAAAYTARIGEPCRQALSVPAAGIERRIKRRSANGHSIF